MIELAFELCLKVFHEHFARVFYDYRQRIAYRKIQHEFISRYAVALRRKSTW